MAAAHWTCPAHVNLGWGRSHLAAYLIDFLYLTPLPPDLSSPYPCVQRFLEVTVALAQHLEPEGGTELLEAISALSLPLVWPGPRPAQCSEHQRGGRYHLL